MVQEGDQVEDDSFNLSTLSIQQAVPLDQLTKSSRWRRIASDAVDQVGDLVLALFGFDETDWFEDSSNFDGEEEESELREMGIEGTSLSSWSESTVYVEVSSHSLFFLLPLKTNKFVFLFWVVAYTILTSFKTISFWSTLTKLSSTWEPLSDPTLLE